MMYSSLCWSGGQQLIWRPLFVPLSKLYLHRSCRWLSYAPFHQSRLSMLEYKTISCNSVKRCSLPHFLPKSVFLKKLFRLQNNRILKRRTARGIDVRDDVFVAKPALNENKFSLLSEVWLIFHVQHTQVKVHDVGITFWPGIWVAWDQSIGIWCQGRLSPLKLKKMWLRFPPPTFKFGDANWSLNLKFRW